MNLYLLVEGKRTEMAVYPAWLSYLIPQMSRVIHPYEARRNHYYIVSGFGYPNILVHLENAVKDVNRYSQYDYLVLCFDADDMSVGARVREVKKALRLGHVSLKRARLKVIIQQKCIETWFLPHPDNRREAGNPVLRQYMEFYDVFSDNPEQMGKPTGYRGSASDFHFRYLCELFANRGKLYTKRKPYEVCKPEYISGLIESARGQDKLNTFMGFVRFCAVLSKQLHSEAAAESVCASDSVD